MIKLLLTTLTLLIVIFSNAQNGGACVYTLPDGTTQCYVTGNAGNPAINQCQAAAAAAGAIPSNCLLSPFASCASWYVSNGISCFFGGTGNCGGGSACDLISLPIEIIEFDGIGDDNVNRIWWTTSSEINNDYFTISKSEDGMNWKQLAKVSGASNSTTLIRYEILDENPFMLFTYYSLSQTDFDGKIEDFDIISVENKSTVFYTYDIEDDFENVYLSSPQYYEVYNMMGQCVNNGYSNTVYIGDLSSGIHILRIGSYLRKIYIN